MEFSLGQHHVPVAHDTFRDALASYLGDKSVCSLYNVVLLQNEVICFLIYCICSVSFFILRFKHFFPFLNMRVDRRYLVRLLTCMYYKGLTFASVAYTCDFFF